MFLSADAIEAMDGTLKTHFLNDNAVRLNKSLGDAVGLKNIGVHLISVEPGHDSTEHHAHHFEEECIYVISGEGVARLGESEQPIRPGDFFGCPTNGIPHSMRATGNEPLVCLVMGQRLKQDVSDYPEQGKRLYRNNGEWELVNHADIHQVRR